MSLVIENELKSHLDAVHSSDDELFNPFPALSKAEKQYVRDSQSYLTNIFNENRSIAFDEISHTGKLFSLRDKIETRINFPRQDVTYQSLIWHFRGIQKVDTHCHLGMGLSINQLSNLVSCLQKADLNLVLKGLQQRSIKGVRGRAVKVISFLPIRFLKIKAVMNFLIRVSGVLRNWNSADFYLVSKQALHLATTSVAENYLKDNVTNFSLRLNPFKKELFPEGTDVETVFKEVVETVVDALDKVAVVYNIPSKQLNITISLNREHQESYLEYSRKIFANWNYFPSKITDRIRGFDLAGAEGNLGESISIKDWTPVLQMLTPSIEFTPHLGDIRNLRNHTSLYRKWIDFVNGKESAIGSLMDLIEEHYNFMQEYIEVMPTNSSIAHGIALSPRIIFLKPSNPRQPKGERKVFVFNLEENLNNEQLETKRKYLLSKLALIKNIIRSKNIKIYFCPTATVKSLSIEDFKSLPIFEWITKDGIKVKIGVDGMYQYPQPKTLSEELTKLFITKPKHSRPLTYKEVVSLTT